MSTHTLPTIPPFALTREAISQNISFETPYGGQFTLSTQLIKPKLACHTPLPPHQHSTTLTL